MQTNKPPRNKDRGGVYPPVVVFRMEPDDLAQLRAIALASGVKVSVVIREAVRRHLKRITKASASRGEPPAENQ